MPVTSYISRTHAIVLSRVHGAMSLEGLQQNQEWLLNEPDFSPDFRQVFDMSGMENLETEGDEVRGLPYIWGQNSRRAIIATDDLAFGMARMYQLISDKEHGGQLGVFRSLEKALEWVGLSEEDYEEILRASGFSQS